MYQYSIGHIYTCMNTLVQIISPWNPGSPIDLPGPLKFVLSCRCHSSFYGTMYFFLQLLYFSFAMHYFSAWLLLFQFLVLFKPWIKGRQPNIASFGTGLHCEEEIHVWSWLIGNPLLMLNNVEGDVTLILEGFPRQVGTGASLSIVVGTYIYLLSVATQGQSFLDWAPPPCQIWHSLGGLHFPL